ncbi:hypothetical protein ABZT06_49460 [Streptomyces sp. NPDC005483]|uniref:hypothetical protein n=1 Tax=Streptomyces sp. NPDC005483 TaxID=3154882 RepID=UPI0033A8B14B
MTHVVLGLGIALVTVSSCVWYLPARADLRAGDDRPVFRRTAAAACLTGWSTAATVSLLLLAGTAWPVPCAMAVTGAAGTAGLRIRARVQRRFEAREVARHWAALEAAPPPHGARQDRARRAFAGLVASGLAAAAAAEVLLVAAGPEDGLEWLVAAAVPAVVVGVFLTLAVTLSRTASGRPTTPGHACAPHEGASGPADAELPNFAIG